MVKTIYVGVRGGGALMSDGRDAMSLLALVSYGGDAINV